MRSCSAQLFTLLFVLISLAQLGCNGENHPMPPATAPTDAKGVLESALQQWTQGKQAADLRQNPADSVLVRDEDWEAGNVLGSFKLLDQGEPFGNDVRFKVELKLTTPAATKKVRYTVSTQPARVIMRDDSME